MNDNQTDEANKSPNDPSSATAGDNQPKFHEPPTSPAVRCSALLGETVATFNGKTFAYSHNKQYYSDYMTESFLFRR